MVSRLQYRDAASTVTDLDTDYFRLRDVIGAGYPPVINQTVRTPGRDGETFVRTIMQPRFLNVEMDIAGGPFSYTQELRRTLLAALNPKRGMGALLWTPDATTYEIPAIVETGLGFEQRGDDMREIYEYLVVSFRCPDPAWRVTPVNQDVISVPDGGLSVSLSIPLSISSNYQTEMLTNAGDLLSYPVIQATGPFTGITIANETTGKQVSFPDLSVALGETLTINMDARTATVEGVNVMPYRSADSESWGLALGDNTITVTLSSGGSTVTVSHWTLLGGV